MFRLGFFLLFVLAGLCFGDASASETVDGASSNGEADPGSGVSSAADGAGGSETAGQPSDGKNQEGQTSDGENQGASNKELGSETGGDIQQQKTVGDHLPDFIGNKTDKIKYMDRLLSLCNANHNLYTINQIQITFENCTFICVSNSPTVQNQQERIPEDLVCNSDREKCPENWKLAQKLYLRYQAAEEKLVLK
uniref:Putative secreted protein n=1 Tax=Ixodes ricinus TaxID=34613 RepID=V5HBG1_IXORI